MKPPVVSVLMPVFNRATLVGETIRSIQEQTFQDWELIILDDGSTDGTIEVCRSFEACDSRIRVFANERNTGVGEARNRLTSYATGNYIAHQDSDDVSLPERLQLEVELLETRPEIGLVCAVAALLDDEGRVFSYLPDNFDLLSGQQYPQDKNEMVQLLFSANKVTNATCMYRRSLLAQIPQPYGNYRVFEDWLFQFHVAHRALIWGIPKVLVNMRRGKNHVHLYTYNERILQHELRMKRVMFGHYKDDPQSPVNYWLYRKSMASLLIRTGMFLGGWKGYFTILQAILFDPFNLLGWKCWWKLSGRAFRKGKRLAFR